MSRIKRQVLDLFQRIRGVRGNKGINNAIYKITPETSKINRATQLGNIAVLPLVSLIINKIAIISANTIQRSDGTE